MTNPTHRATLMNCSTADTLDGEIPWRPLGLTGQQPLKPRGIWVSNCTAMGGFGLGHELRLH